MRSASSRHTNGILLVVILLLEPAWSDRPVSWSFLGLSAIYLANSVRLFGVSTDYGVLWSLAVEEHFYLLWPFCVQKLRRGGLMILAVLICVLSLGCRIAAFWLGFNALGPYTWMVADGLAMGAILAIAARNFARIEAPSASSPLEPSLSQCWDILRIALPGIRCLAAQFTSRASTVFMLEWLRALFFSAPASPSETGCSNLSERSATVSYLIHVLCFDLYDHYSARFWPSWQGREGNFGLIMLRFLASVALAIAIAFLSRRYFEEPFLRLKDRLAPTGHRSFRRQKRTPSAPPPAKFNPACLYVSHDTPHGGTLRSFRSENALIVNNRRSRTNEGSKC